MGGGKGVDKVVDEDVGVDPPVWDITGLEGVDEVSHEGLKAGGEGGGQDFVGGIEEGDGANMVEGGDGVSLLRDIT